MSKSALARASENVVMESPKWAWERLAGWLAQPRLALRLVAIAVVLSSPALLLGFYLDDYIGRYIYSDLEGAARLFRNYSGGYGLAIGDPVENQWQREAGWAPWWHYDHLRLALWRPIGVALHALDFRLWPESAWLMHAHNLLWLGALVAAVTWMYRTVFCAVEARGVAGERNDVDARVVACERNDVDARLVAHERSDAFGVGGAAALLFALDQTHGYAVGHICNRHALVSALLGALCLGFHARQGRTGRLRDAWQGPLCYVLALLTSESSAAIAGYVLAYTLCVETSAWRARALRAAPYVAITLGWRALYNALGYGAEGSSIYIDVGREPLAFARAFLERGPILWLGQFFTPSAELYVVVSKPTARLIWLWAAYVLVASLVILAPLVRRDRLARAWALGMLGSMVPAAAAEPHNRQLVFASFGALGLLAQLWRAYAVEARVGVGERNDVEARVRAGERNDVEARVGAGERNDVEARVGVGERNGVEVGAGAGEQKDDEVAHSPAQRVRKFLGISLLGFRLLISPLLLPVSTASIAFTAPMHLGAASIGADVAGRDLILVTAPEYFSVRMVQLMKRLARGPLPRRIRAISCEPEPIRVKRTDPRTLEVQFERGLLSRPMADLHRDRRLAMPPGTQVHVSGFDVEVLRSTPDGRPELVRFRFVVPLEDSSLVFYRWDERRFVPFRPPALGTELVLPGAKPRVGLR